MHYIQIINDALQNKPIKKNISFEKESLLCIMRRYSLHLRNHSPLYKYDIILDIGNHYGHETDFIQ